MDVSQAIANKKLPMTAGDKYRYWIAPVTFFVLSFFAVYMLFTNKIDLVTGIIMFSGCFFLGIKASVKINYFFKLHFIKSKVDATIQKEILNELALIFGWHGFQVQDNHYKYRYRKRFFTTAFKVTILTDSNGFYLNVQYDDVYPFDYGGVNYLRYKVIIEIMKQIKRFEK